MNKFIKKVAACSLPAVLLIQSLSAGAWTTHIDCEGGASGTKVLEGGASTLSSSFALTKYSNEQAGTGSQSCKMGITQGTDGWGDFGGTYTFPSKLAAGSQVWSRVSLFVPQGFQISTNTGMLKFIRIHTASPSNINQGYHDLLLSYPGATFWDPVLKNYSASYIYNYEGNPGLSRVGIPPTNDVVKGQWETYEIYVKLDPVSKDAGGTGEVKIWKNNSLLLDRTNIGTLVDSTSFAESLFLFTYWNGNAPATQSLYVDDITVTSDTPANRDAQGNPYIGAPVMNSKPLPMPPSNLKVTP